MGFDLLFIESRGTRDRLFVGNVLLPDVEKGIHEPGHVEALLLALCVFRVTKA